MNAKTGVGIMTVMAVVVVAVVAVFALVQFMPATKAEVDQAESAEKFVETMVVSDMCGDDNLGYFRPALINPLNKASTEYLTNTLRVYQMQEDGSELFYGTVGVHADGMQSRGTGALEIECSRGDKVLEYKAYIPALNGNQTSTVVEFVAAEDVPMEIYMPQHAGLLFKIYDNDNKGYVYAKSGAAAVADAQNSWSATATTYASTSSNTSGLDVGTDGSFDYTIIVATNATAATDTQFEDQATYLYTDMDDLSDWDELDVTISGATVTSIDFPNSKIANDGYDYAYELTEGTSPLHLDTTKVEIDIAGWTLSGVDASDDITIGLGTSGYFKETVGSGMLMDTNKDDSSKTTVYTIQTCILDLD